MVLSFVGKVCFFWFNSCNFLSDFIEDFKIFKLKLFFNIFKIFIKWNIFDFNYVLFVNILFVLMIIILILKVVF